jgi:GMP synthase (glutamine-hydrolysing)
VTAPRLLVIQHNLDDHLNELGGPLIDAGLEIEPWFTTTGPEPDLDASAYHGIVSLGALAGLEDEAEHPWMSTERRVLEKALAGGVPTLGICFGAQMLASIAGAEVRRAEVPEIGWATVEMDPAAADDPVLCVLGERLSVFQYHYDAFGSPENGRILGWTGATNQVLAVGERAWGVQFHVEVNPGTVFSWIGTYGEEMRAHGVDVDAVAVETRERWTTYREVARALSSAFAREVVAFAEGA